MREAAEHLQEALAGKRELHTLRKQLSSTKLHASLIACDRTAVAGRAAAAGAGTLSLIGEDDASFASLETDPDNAEEQIHVLQTQVGTRHWIVFAMLRPSWGCNGSEMKHVLSSPCLNPVYDTVQTVNQHYFKY